MGKWCLNPIYSVIMEEGRLFVKCSFTKRKLFEIQGKNPIKIKEMIDNVIEDGREIEERTGILLSLVNKVLLRKDSKDFCIYDHIYRRVIGIQQDYPDMNVQEMLSYLLECSNKIHILSFVDDWGKSLKIEENLPFRNITTYEYNEADKIGEMKDQSLGLIESNSWVIIAAKNLSQISRGNLEVLNRKVIKIDCNIFILSTDDSEENIKYGPMIKPSITGCIMCLNEIDKEKPFDVVKIENKINGDDISIIDYLPERLGVDILYYLVDEFYDFGTNYTRMLGVELTCDQTHNEIQYRELTRNPQCTQC